MANRYYVVDNGTTVAIWEAEPQSFLELQKRKPEFKVVNSYATRAEAEVVRQQLQNPK